MPPSYNHRTHPSKLTRPPPGYCRWCALPILKVDGTINRRRSWCSQQCVGEYLLRTDAKMYRQHIFFRDDGVCARCNKKHRYNNGDWQADHILPLAIAFGDPAFWDPENLQLLCTDPCHKEKSAEDRTKYSFIWEAERKRRLAAPNRSG
jgi:5-methylcytosine-specific restriction endonuclease McrA